MLRRLLIKLQVRSAQSNASKITRGFSKVHNQLIMINEELNGVHESAEEDIKNILAVAQAKVDILRAHQETSKAEILLNTKVITNLQNLVR
jgi:uncharacterized protein involved in exopolysaccharide biosynthesis